VDGLRTLSTGSHTPHSGPAKRDPERAPVPMSIRFEKETSKVLTIGAGRTETAIDKHEWGLSHMKIKVTTKKYASTTHQRAFKKLADHAMNHYPKDTALHKAVRGAFQAMDDAAAKLGKDAKKSATAKRKPARKSARKRVARKAGPARRKVAKRPRKAAAPKRATRRVAKRSTAKRSTTAKRRVARRGAPPRRRVAKRRVMRRAA